MLCRACVESDYTNLIKQNGLGLTIFSRLKTAILTGKYNAGIPPDSRFSKAVEQKSRVDFAPDIELPT